MLVTNLRNIVQNWSRDLLVDGLLQLKDLHVLFVLDHTLPDLNASIIKCHEHGSNWINIWELDTWDSNEEFLLSLGVCLGKTNVSTFWLLVVVEIDIEATMTALVLLGALKLV